MNMTIELKRAKAAEYMRKKRAADPERTKELARISRARYKEKSRVTQKFYYDRNAEIIRAKQRAKNLARYASDPEKWRGLAKQHLEKNRAAINLRRREKRRLNRDAVLAAERAYWEANPLRQLAKNRNWAANNRIKVLAAASETAHRRRAHIKTLPKDPATRDFIRSAKAMTSFACEYCYGPHLGSPTIDHKIPLNPENIRIPKGQHVLENLAHSCGPCNSAKHNKTPEEFFQYRIQLAEARMMRGARKTRSRPDGQAAPPNSPPKP